MRRLQVSVVDVEAPEILDVATTALPSDSEVVLELPGQETSGPRWGESD